MKQWAEHGFQSDNVRVLRAAGENVQAKNKVDHRRSVSNAWLSVGFGYEVTESWRQASTIRHASGKQRRDVASIRRVSERERRDAASQRLTIAEVIV
ncbi:hypothetical protein [Rubripirellula obstinata]|uniref:hypothetical protein n=1 Tax=Rubripirellula obstinata TaxID=406547 RepID=UPI000835A108|nr:hypothetical protein [Rubripirellula obstinata]